MTSYKVEVQTDASGKWYGNALRFANAAEATASAIDLASRWYAVREWRVTPCADPVGHLWRDGRLVCIVGDPMPNPAAPAGLTAPVL